MPTGDEKNKVEITNDVRIAWNDYVKWLRAKGVAGNPILDKGGVGQQYLMQYIKENPNTALTPEVIAPLQQDFLKYKDYALNQVKIGKSVFAPGVNADNFMEDLSTEDGYVGSKTSSHLFPIEYLRYVDKSAGTDVTVNKGFATTQK